ncbi:M43 family zinc metalloprotease [Aquimarina sp. 2201CG14-23]|uniref:M43 family zinc metalloprotease n=1 Tax=Aquimarina mycalae TaxID=3040073 RepID=UPI002477E101|nr:M43 family zinc metalloprotease [Aquimarina sp. 2201CG14-23]MDH7448025.1 M43 family zinc metalloprotease [Aquimarina sp. 2201CG14-23]
MNLRIKITTVLLLIMAIVQAQERSCLTSKAMKTFFKENPKEYQEFMKFNEYSKEYTRNSFEKSANFGEIIIPVVFHVYGRTQNGTTVSDETIINSLQMVNEDFQGLNPDFNTVDPLFESRKSTTNIVFKLAKIDPNGNPTTGIVEHAVAAGQGLVDSPIVSRDAWDNYKYMNVYIAADILDNGKDYNSGIAWYPSKRDSDLKFARVVYNGRYLKGNTDDEFASLLTHEFGHWLNLIHTFEGGCASFNQDFVEDTPQEDVASADDECVVGATDCGDSLINYENYMGYDASGGCAKMFTKGQTDRMYAALNHSTRLPLWQNANLIATGVGGSLEVIPRMNDGVTWIENAGQMTVCPGTNIKIGMQNVGTSNVSIMKPDGLVDTTPDGTTFWDFNNVQKSDEGVYLIRYADATGNIGFAAVNLYVGYKVQPWIQIDNTTNDYSNQDEIIVCEGANISITTQTNLPEDGTRSLILPNGNLHTVPSNNGVWAFDNVTAANAGTYTIRYEKCGITYTTEVTLIIGKDIAAWTALNNDWKKRSFVEACIGDKVHLGMGNVGLENVTLTGPNGFFDDTPDVATGFEFASITAQDYGTYTITWNDPATCAGSAKIELRPKYEDMDSWVRDSAGTWSQKETLFACVGDNIGLGTHNSFGPEDIRITYPDGTVNTNPDPDFKSAWVFNNIQKSDEGMYKIEYTGKGCYSTTNIFLKVGVEDLNNAIEYQVNNNGYTTSVNNAVSVDEGDKIRLRFPENSFEGTVSWIGPDGFTANRKEVIITDVASTGIHAGIYTATITHNYDCSSAGNSRIETINFEVKFNGASNTCSDGIQNGDETGVDCGGSSCAPCAIAVDGGTISTSDDKTEITTITGDGVADLITFKKVNQSEASYAYLITDEAGKILTIETISHDFEGAVAGICKVYGISYNGDLIVIGKNVADSGLASVNFEISSNSITVTREEVVTPTCTDGIQNGDETGVDCGGSSCEPCQTDVTYCEDKSTRTSGEYISNISVGSINNSTTRSANGYGDHTSVSTNLAQGSSVTISITPNWGGAGPYNEAYGVWIDYNQDGDFADAGEQVFTKTPSQNTPVTGTFTIPNTAKTGDTRMRVIMEYFNNTTSVPEVCKTNHNYGETEDYTVNITGNSGSTCTDGIQNGDETGIDCGGSSCEPCVVEPTCTDGIQNGDETGVDCGGSSCEPCQTDVTYCEDKSTRTSGEYISNISVGSINNSTTRSTNGYGDHTSASTNLAQGSSVTISITPNWGGAGPYNEAYGVWIDYNQDGDFADAGEQVFIKTSSQDTPVTGTFSIPNTAKTGDTRMRVIMEYFNNTTSVPEVCKTNHNYGETEDYTVTITGNSVPTCTDGIQNGDETGIDCGGSSCEPCAVEPTCTDGIQNGDETGVDCGGSSCTPCATSGTVVYVDIDDNTTSATSSWNPFQIEIGDERYFGPWLSGNTLRLVNYGKDVVCDGTTDQVTVLGEGIEIGPSSNFVENTNSFVISSSSYTDWNGKSGYIGFTFKVSGATHYGWFYATVSSDGASFTITDYAYNTTAGQSLLTQRPSTTKSNDFNLDLKVYPNPFKESFTLDVSKLKKETFSITMYNILGQSIFEKTYTNNPRTVSFGNEITNNGTYFVKVRSASTNIVLPVVKQ